MAWAQPDWPIGEPGQWRDGEDVSGPVLYGRIGRRVEDLRGSTRASNCAGYFPPDDYALSQNTAAQLKLSDPANIHTVSTGGVYTSGDVLYFPTPGVYLVSCRLTQYEYGAGGPFPPNLAFSGRTWFEWRLPGEVPATRRIPVPASPFSGSFDARVIVVCPTQAQAQVTFWWLTADTGGRLAALQVTTSRLVQL